MRTTPRLTSITLTALLVAGGAIGAINVAAQDQNPSQTGMQTETERREHNFGVAEFDRFHQVLHPLQHEALPQNDLARIRREARNLVLAGRPLTNIAIPAGVRDTAEFCDEQADFTDALKRFDRAAANGNDAALRRAYIRVHDTFEEMAVQLARR